MHVSASEVHQFQKTVWDYFHDHARMLPWRQTDESGAYNPYYILVSEVMLQQTQVPRVIPKYEQFLQKFPDIQALAAAKLKEVLTLWSGLGYNRRAKFLWEAAKIIIEVYGGSFPSNLDELVKLPGVGKNTAAAVLAYSYNQPVVFIETNIRSVFLHHFFPDQVAISDVQLLPLIEQTLPIGAAREWYWALMDYGSYLKTSQQNPSRGSKHHGVQSRFEGSKRQVRGQVLKLLLQDGATTEQLSKVINDPRLNEVLADLVKEALITQIGATYHLGR